MDGKLPDEDGGGNQSRADAAETKMKVLSVGDPSSERNVAFDAALGAGSKTKLLGSEVMDSKLPDEDGGGNQRRADADVTEKKVPTGGACVSEVAMERDVAFDAGSKKKLPSGGTLSCMEEIRFSEDDETEEGCYAEDDTDKDSYAQDIYDFALAPDPAKESDFEDYEDDKVVDGLTIFKGKGVVQNDTGKACMKCDDNGFYMKGNEASSSKNGAEKVHFPAKDAAGHGAENVNSMLKKAMDESDEALQKVANLSFLAMQLKSSCPHKSKTKMDYLKSTTDDTWTLAEIVENSKDTKKKCINLTSKLPRYHIRSSPKESSAKGCSNYKSPGCELIQWLGSFAVPSSCISGNDYVDQMNVILFDLMMSVTQILEGGQAVKSLAKACGEKEDTATDVDRRAAIGKLRSTCKSIRVTILNLGYLPLKEPIAYWRKTCGLVRF